MDSLLDMEMAWNWCGTDAGARLFGPFLGEKDALYDLMCASCELEHGKHCHATRTMTPRQVAKSLPRGAHLAHGRNFATIFDNDYQEIVIWQRRTSLPGAKWAVALFTEMLALAAKPSPTTDDELPTLVRQPSAKASNAFWASSTSSCILTGWP